jgi:hypothetical protein
MARYYFNSTTTAFSFAMKKVPNATHQPLPERPR